MAGSAYRAKIKFSENFTIRYIITAVIKISKLSSLQNVNCLAKRHQSPETYYSESSRSASQGYCQDTLQQHTHALGAQINLTQENQARQGYIFIGDSFYFNISGFSLR